MKRLALVALLAGGSVLAGAFAFGAFTRSETVDLTIELGAWSEKFNDCLGQQPESRASACLQETSEQAASLGDIGPALAILRKGLERNATLAGKCHAVVHTVGQEAVGHGVTLLEAYAVPFVDCRFGFYHGALEAHTRNLDIVELEAEMGGLCAPFGDDDQPATGECAHVLGHFVFDRVLPDIDRGFAICGTLTSTRLQGRCSDGVLMQSIDLIKPAVGDPSHERYPLIADIWGEDRETQLTRAETICDAVTSAEGAYICNTNLPQALSVLWSGQDYPALHTFCAGRQGDDWKQACFEGIAASGFAGLDWDERKIVDACHASDDPNTRFCIGTLAFTYVLYTSEERARAICELAREHEVDLCIESVANGVVMRDSLTDSVNAIDDGDYDIYSQ